ncbi:MAG: dihydrofolate reductase [Candidatus Paceibacterota bacterium]|jgi:dihydrofolate reductase
MISIIVAVDKNFLIGKQGGLPWHLPADFAHFKKITMGHPVIMGRKTFDSIGKTLPGRTNIVISRGGSEKRAKSNDIFWTSDVSLAIGIAKKSPGANEIFVIGGAQIFEQTLPLADKLYFTFVDAIIAGGDGSIYFPPFDKSEWREVSREDFARDDKNEFNFSFVNYEHKNNRRRNDVHVPHSKVHRQNKGQRNFK